MNGRKSRATAVKQRPSALDRVTAFHESGHAVARVLVASETGQPIEEAVSHIDVGLGQQVGRSADRNATLYSMATTYGPWLPPIATDFVMSLVSGDIIALEHLKEAMRVAEYAGVDVKAWAGGRVFHIAAGAAAEAKFTKRTFDAVWNSYACESDMKAAFRDCQLAGLNEISGSVFIDLHANRAVDAMERANVWNAVSVLADRLPNAGRLAGSDAIAIIREALREK